VFGIASTTVDLARLQCATTSIYHFLFVGGSAALVLQLMHASRRSSAHGAVG
jgi:hypothetical protein